MHPHQGTCVRCGEEGELLDGTLCDECHTHVCATYEEQVTRFGLYYTGDDGAEERDNVEEGLAGGLVAVGVTYRDDAVLAWLVGPPSAEVYQGIEDVMQVYQNRQNLAFVWF
jgi:hypothetical protein